MKDDRHVMKKYGVVPILVAVFSIQAILFFGAGLERPSVGWAASADPALPQGRPEKGERSASTPAAAQPRKVPDKPAVTPEKKKTPYKEFVPSERIEPDHAVDFPADI